MISLLVYKPTGKDPMSPSNFVFGLFFNLLSVALVFYLMRQTGTGKYTNKVIFVGLLGLFAGIVVPLSESVWFGFPASYTFGIVLVLIVGWTLVGLVLGRFTFTSTENST